MANKRYKPEEIVQKLRQVDDLSASLNPPEREDVPVEVFEAAIDRIEGRLGLEGQPRAVVFHEKEGRRHAHAVWGSMELR